MSNFKNQKAIFSENLAGFLIMRGHWLHSQKKDLRKPNRWVYFFNLDDNFVSDMLCYGKISDKIREIVQKT